MSMNNNNDMNFFPMCYIAHVCLTVFHHKEDMQTTRYIHSLKAPDNHKKQSFLHFFWGMHQIDNYVLQIDNVLLQKFPKFAAVTCTLCHIGKFLVDHTGFRTMKIT